MTLPDQLDSSAAWSPYLFGYYASLNLLDAKALFSNMKIGDLFDPGVKQVKQPVERHHLYPKAYLSSIGITGSTKTNQIANFAFVEWADNIAISDKKPSEYFPARMASLRRAIGSRRSSGTPSSRLGAHGLLRVPAARRKRMAAVVRAGFEHLRSGGGHHEGRQRSPSPHGLRPAAPHGDAPRRVQDVCPGVARERCARRR